MKRRELTEFGILVKKRLVELGKTQKELAEAVGVGDVYLNVILHGQRSGAKYVKPIADHLELEIPCEMQARRSFARGRKEDGLTKR